MPSGADTSESRFLIAFGRAGSRPAARYTWVVATASPTLITTLSTANGLALDRWSVGTLLKDPS
jgi:hypothetical protein